MGELYRRLAVRGTPLALAGRKPVGFRGHAPAGMPSEPFVAVLRALWVFRGAGPGWASPAELVESTGLHPTTVRRVTARMVAMDVAEVREQRRPAKHAGSAQQVRRRFRLAEQGAALVDELTAEGIFPTPPRTISDCATVTP